VVKEDGEGEVEDVRARECLLDTMFALSKPSWLASLAFSFVSAYAGSGAGSVLCVANINSMFLRSCSVCLVFVVLVFSRCG